MQTCDNCGGKKEHSQEWSLSAELAKSNRRMFIALLVVIVLWAATIVGFLLYLNQFDVEGIDVVQDGLGLNNFNNSGTQGDVTYEPANPYQEKD